MYIEAAAQHLPDRIERPHEQDKRRARHDDEMRRLTVVEHRVADHRAPVRRRRLHSEAEETQPRDRKHPAPEPQRTEHEQRPAERRQNVPEDHPSIAAAEHTQILYIGLRREPHDLRTHDAREPRPRARNEREQ